MLPRRTIDPHAPAPPSAGDAEDPILSTMPAPCPGLAPVIRYVVGARGKRLRSRLLRLSARVLSPDPSHLPEAAALVELLHNGTLLHDDVMDRADVRRHRPTVNRLWGEPVAILAGDFLLASVMDLALRTGREAIARLAVDTLMALVAGQMQEIRNQGNLSLGEAEYLDTIRRKTGSLFAAACRIGGLIAGGAPEPVRALTTFGMEFGLAYQILDDLQDYLSTSARTGKEPGRDLAEAKVTLPLLFAFQKADIEGQRRMRLLFSERNRYRHLEEFRTLLSDLDGFSLARSRAAECVRRAESALATLPEGEARTGLAHIARTLIERSPA